VNLDFDDPLEVGGRPTATVPPGFSRPVCFAVIHPATAESDSEGRSVAGRLALYPRRLAETAILLDLTMYEVEATVTGANVRAVTYRGVFEIDGLDPDEGQQAILEFRWKTLPRAK
jgi:hypothetical protein